jgi:plastocyanin
MRNRPPPVRSLLRLALVLGASAMLAGGLATGPLPSTPMVAAGEPGNYGYGGTGTTVTSAYVTVKAQDDYFDPDILRVAVGTTVEWQNTGRNPHTVTADDGSFDSGNMDPGVEWSHQFTQAGVYRYYCRYHGAKGGQGMAGIILVGDAPLPGPAGNVGPGREPVPSAPGKTIRVPQDSPTIQGAVNQAEPGDMVLIGPGTYHEAVQVLTPYLTIRGTDRNAVILDGELKMANGIHVIDADGVAVENLTVAHYALNGVYWTGVNGYFASYVTAYANGDYGIYAFDSVWGRIEHSWASGSPDSGFYIGQCYPCHAVIDDVTAVGSALGYSGTNAGGDLWIVNSEWRDNMAGIVPNTLDSEKLAPQREVTIAGNWVHDNNNAQAPADRLEWPSFGVGILVAGGRRNDITGNLVEDQATFGIALLPNLDANLWLTQDNTVTGNLVRRSGRGDLALGAASGGGDCFSRNDFARSVPPAIEQLSGCGGVLGRSGGGEPGATYGLLLRFAEALNGHNQSGDWRTQPAPLAQPQMPGAATAPITLEVPETVLPGPHIVRSLDALERLAATGPGTSAQPGAATAASATIGPEVTVLGFPLASSFFGILIGLYGYVFPFMLYTAWVVIALWDLLRREDVAGGARLGWMAGVLVVPLVGPIAYYLAGGSPIPRSARWLLVVGGMAVYVALAVLGFVLA